MADSLRTWKMALCFWRVCGDFASCTSTKDSIHLETIGDATRLTDEWELETGRNPLLEWLGTMKIKSAVEENLERLRQLLETGETRLQDGRTMRN